MRFDLSTIDRKLLDEAMEGAEGKSEQEVVTEALEAMIKAYKRDAVRLYVKGQAEPACENADVLERKQTGIRTSDPE